MSDISITITADPQQAVAGIEQVKRSAESLAETQRKVQAASDAAATDAVNSVLTVSRETVQAVSQTSDALGQVSGGIKTAATEAAKVSGALGKSIPVVQQLGSAISSAITGPVGAVSAAVGLAIAGIMKMIRDAREQIELLRMKAEGATNGSYDALMKGRQDYADQLQVLAQVREINRYAEQNKLTADQLAQFRQLAGQIGIAERDVGDRGIRSGKLGEAARSLRQQREFYAKQEYRDYTTNFDRQLLDAIMSSDLSEFDKNKLGVMTTADRVKTITQAARLGSGSTMDEYKGWQNLYGMVSKYEDVASSYSRDMLLGRDQKELNAIFTDSIRAAADKAAKKAASGSSGPAAPGTLAWAKEQDKIAQKELDAQKERAKRGEKLLENLDRQIAQQELIKDGNEREAFLLRNRLQLEDTLGQKLTAQQAAEVDARAGRLYDLQHPVLPDLAPENPSSPASPARARRQSAGYSLPLDDLQRIGARLPAGVSVSSVKMVLDQSRDIQKNILNFLQASLSSPRAEGGMYFT